MQTKKEVLKQYVDRFEEANRGTIEIIPIEFLEVLVDIRDVLVEIAQEMTSANDLGAFHPHSKS